jgi:hypothetical protein
LGYHPLNGVAFKPTGQTYALIASASSFKFSPLVVQPTNIVVNTKFPHISRIEVFDNAWNPRTNSQVDVNTGMGGDTTMYYIEADLYHEDGFPNIVQADLFGWFDQGNVGLLSEAVYDLAETPNSAENRQFHLRWTRGGVPSEFEIIYPNPARYGFNPEIALDLPNCGYTDDIIPTEWNMTLTFAFIPYQQTVNAPGPFSELPGWRWDMMFGPQEEPDPNNPVYAPLNDPNTWDFRLQASDTGGGIAIASDEFGIFRYQALTMAGTPGGGLLQGQGPPSTNNISLNPQNAVVNFSSNCQLNLSVYVTDLVSVPDTIPATALSTWGGDIGAESFFTAAGTGGRQFYLGGVGWWYNSLAWNRYSETDDWGGLINWEVNIPAVVEDTYPGTVTYTLGRPP